MKIAIFGTYPPPIGGTSIHIKRLYDLLNDSFEVKVYDTYGESNVKDSNIISVKNYKKFLFKYFFTSKDKIIHSHSHSWNERLILTVVAILRRKKIIFTYHSFRDEWGGLSLLTKLKVKFVLKFATFQISVNEEMKMKLISWGAKSSKVKLIPTFLLPRKSEGELSNTLKDFRKTHKWVICANASNNNKYKNKDLYGIDLSIELCKKLNEKYDVGFVFALTKTTDISYYNYLVDRVKKLGLEEKFIFTHEKNSLVPLLKESDIFVRPTNTDSYGISVGEALSVRTPSVASNVCERPEGTVLFENRSFVDFYEKVENLMLNYEYNIEIMRGLSVKDYSEETLKMYKNLFLNS